MLIGREEQQETLMRLLESDKSEFVAVYGRRRVGKTYLIRETYREHFVFQHTGLQKGDKKAQLKEFCNSLELAGMRKVPKLKDWSDAFFALAKFIQTLRPGKKVIFIDELPWMETPKSNLVSALDHFWNSWASARNDIVLVVCGSATSWIIKKIVKNYGGLHNRLTRQIHLKPFCLNDCERFATAMHLGMSRRNILETYMVLGGVPYYWQCMQREYSWAQNINRLFFHDDGELQGEFDALYASLFRNPKPYIDIITALGTKKAGMTREEIRVTSHQDKGGKLTEMLEELEQCDFIRSFSSIGKRKKETMYQLIDNFTLFYFKFLAGKRINEQNYWSMVITKPEYNSWSGVAFERVCFQHIEQIKRALGISGIICNVYSWIYKPGKEERLNETESKSESGAMNARGKQGVQIDMLLDRDDNVINLCEMKFTKGPYEITSAYDEELARKASVFMRETGTKKGVSTIMVTSYGLVRNGYANGIQNQVTMEDLFRE